MLINIGFDKIRKMKMLQEQIKLLKQNEQISIKIYQKLSSFKKFRVETNEALFSELCYCILTANCQAKTCIAIQKTFPFDFSIAKKEQIKKHLREHHYRFPNIRTQYILDAQIYKNKIRHTLQNYSGLQRREWFIDNIKGLGIKEASHYLRNIGYDEYAIIDTHILSLLDFYQIINKPKTLTKKRYLDIEGRLKILAKETNLTLSSLDLYLWYMKTGLILK